MAKTLAPKNSRKLKKRWVQFFLAEVSFNNFVDDGFDFFCCLDVLFLLELIDSNLILVLIEFPKWLKPVAVAKNHFRDRGKFFKTQRKSDVI